MNFIQVKISLTKVKPLQEVREVAYNNGSDKKTMKSGRVTFSYSKHCMLS